MNYQTQPTGLIVEETFLEELTEDELSEVNGGATEYIGFKGQIAGFSTNSLSVFLRLEGLGEGEIRLD